MTWMNEFDVEDMTRRYGTDSLLGPAVLTLQALVVWTNSHSDGWPYWSKPAKAADKLMDLLQQHDRWARRAAMHLPHEPATDVAVKAALRPIKAFRTRMAKELRGGCDFPIYDTWADVEAAAAKRRAEIEADERATLARLKEKYADA